MSVIPQIFAIWRASVLLTVGAISLGAERLENSVKGLLKPGERPERAARVKVPVRAGKVENTGNARPRVATKRAAKPARVTRAAHAHATPGHATPAKKAVRKVRVKAGHTPDATSVIPATTSVEALVEGQNSAN